MNKLEKVLHSNRRVAVVGQPGTGKTTLANQRDDAIHTDDYIAEFDWDGTAQAALEQASQQDSYVIEGVTAARAVRANPDAFDAVIVLENIHKGTAASITGLRPY